MPSYTAFTWCPGKSVKSGSCHPIQVICTQHIQIRILSNPASCCLPHKHCCCCCFARPLAANQQVHGVKCDMACSDCAVQAAVPTILCCTAAAAACWPGVCPNGTASEHAAPHYELRAPNQQFSAFDTRVYASQRLPRRLFQSPRTTCYTCHPAYELQTPQLA
jgi:hypothetical protein